MHISGVSWSPGQTVFQSWHTAFTLLSSRWNSHCSKPSGHLVVPDFFSLNLWYDVISHSHLNLPSHLNLLRSNVVDIFFILMSYLCLLFGKIPNSTFTFWIYFSSLLIHRVLLIYCKYPSVVVCGENIMLHIL